jgi:hypothetical protein
MKRVVFGNAVHLSKLLKLHSGHLSIWTTVDEFKERYPCAAKSGWARNLFFLQFCNWTDEFVDIIENQWGNEDYTLLFPKFSPYPCQITPYLLSMVTKLREIEVKLGASDRKVDSWEDEKKKLPDTDAEIKKKTGALKAEVEKEKKKKYVVSAAAAGVAAGVTKLVTDSV